MEIEMKQMRVHLLAQLVKLLPAAPTSHIRVSLQVPVAQLPTQLPATGPEGKQQKWAECLGTC